MIRGDDHRTGDRDMIGADHLEAIDGMHEAAESTVNLRVSWCGERYETVIFARPTPGKSFH